MKLSRTRKISKVAMAVVALALPVYSAPIGMVSSLGVYTANEASATGTMDVSAGTLLQTTTQPGDVKLRTGVDLRLATRSTGTIYSDHVVLQQGAVRISDFAGYAVQANSLRIEPDTSAAQALVRMDGRTVEVASIGGDLKVTDGVATLTRVAAGTKVLFQLTGAAPASSAQPKKQNGQILPISDRKVLVWTAIVVSATALGIAGYVLSR